MNSSDRKTEPSPQDLKVERDRRAIIDKLRMRIPDKAGVGCFLCRMIVEDFDQSGKLTDAPYDLNGKGTFPFSGKRDHIRIELLSLDQRKTLAV